MNPEDADFDIIGNQLILWVGFFQEFFKTVYIRRYVLCIHV